MVCLCRDSIDEIVPYRSFVNCRVMGVVLEDVINWMAWRELPSRTARSAPTRSSSDAAPLVVVPGRRAPLQDPCETDDCVGGPLYAPRCV